MNSFQITEWCHHFIREQVKSGDLCIDATAGNGHDTLLLSQLTGPDGTVLAFDIQQKALDATKKRLSDNHAADNVRLCADSHSHMKNYAEKGTVSCIVFNFGYLPSGDHTICTQSSTSIPAIQQGLELLKTGGLMSLCIYSGQDSGFEERDALLDYLKTLDSKKYLVILSCYYNRPNHPPIPVLIRKLT
ncbi:MAG: class I SAM-dependent methyltransferase [Oliverpabstia sp.]